MSSLQKTELKRSLSPILLWGLGVGYVISGMYFGWNLGLAKGGSGGFAIATCFIIVLYTTFTFSYAELACAIPKAGGGFDYAKRALGTNWGFLVGMAQNIEFLFAPPAIAFAIGAYFHLFFPQLPILVIAIFSYLVFTLLNSWGVKAAATFELIITMLAVAELLVFVGMTIPHFELNHLEHNAFPNGWQGVFAAIPFAIWFFLAIEGVANLAEETINPKRTLFVGFGSSLTTLVILCILVFMSSVGVGGWESIVYDSEGALSDSPLPLALAPLVGTNNWMYHALITLGLFGLIASFHGIILAAGRSTYEFGKVKFAPAFLGKIHPRFKTPVNALWANTCIGIAALLTGRTSEIITIAVFGALSLYIISMISLIQLRKNEPELPRPFRVPAYPFFPIIALVISVVSFVSMTIFYPIPAFIYFLIAGICFTTFKLYQHQIRN